MDNKNRPDNAVSPRRWRWMQAAGVVLLALAWWRSEALREEALRAAARPEAAAGSEAAPRVAEAALGLSTIEVIVGRNDTLDRIFRNLELSLSDLASLRAMPELRSHLDRLHPGELLKISTRAGEFFGLERQLSASETLKVVRAPDGFATDLIENPVERTLRTATAEIRSSLFQAAGAAGIADGTALKIADIFAWDIDFVLDIQPGDRFSVTYEQLSQDGEPLGDGQVLAVEFVNAGRIYRAVRYVDPAGTASYFTPEGRSLRKAFLRAPVEFTRVSSRFNPNRRHPVLNRMRAHKGVDYAAPIGTPVRAAGDGRVRFVGWKGGYGKVVEIEHAGQVRTLYGHLSRHARGLDRGDRVRQGEVIGHVGMTGLATGPHLHYEYLHRGVHKDPQRVPLPKAAPVPETLLADFRAQTSPLLARLDAAAPAAAMVASTAAAPSLPARAAAGR